MPHHRRLPPSGPPNRSLKARTPARPDGATLKPPAPAAGGFTLSVQERCLTPFLRLRVQERCLTPFLRGSGQIRGARVDDRGVREDVDERGPAGREGALERRPQLAGRPHELALAAERLRDEVVAGLGLQ